MLDSNTGNVHLSLRMARYRQFGGLDDVRIEDGDVGFSGMNLRLPVWQLPAGMLSMSQNGRIDGHWVPRRGVDVVTVGSLVSGSPLRLPFWLVDQTGGAAISAASLTGNVVSLTVTGHGLPIGGTGASITINPSGADNSITFTAVSIGEEGNAITVEIAEALLGVDIQVAVAESAITITPRTKARMRFVNGSEDSGWLIHCGTDGVHNNYSSDGSDTYPGSGDWWIIEYVGGLYQTYRAVKQPAVGNPDVYTADSGGDAYSYPSDAPWSFGSVVTSALHSAQQVIDAVNSDWVASLLVTASASGAVTGSVDTVAIINLQGGVDSVPAYLGVEGLGFVTTDPNGVQLVTPTDENTLTFPLTGGNETFTVAGADVVRSVIDDFATEELLGACLFSDPSSNNDEYIFLAYGLEVKRVKLSDGSVSSIGLPGSETIDSEVHMVQAMDKVLLFRPGLVALQWESGDTDFSLVSYGAYTQPQVLQSTAAAVSSGAVTFTVSGNTTIAVGDWVTIYSTTDSRFTEFVGRQFECTSITSTTTVVLQMPVANSASSASATQIGKRVSVGGGYIHQPGFPWAIYFQRRIWGPYQYFWDTTLTPDAFSDRNIRDELIAGDILDSDTYDAISNQFRITGGVADYLVGLHPFFDDTLLVFMRNSIHSISGTVGSLLDTSVRELTREIGCVARKSVVSQGNSVFFLSDNGVYGLEFQDLYNLRGIERPLSENIQPLIDRISRDLASGAVAAYHDNRYWLAVPLDSTPRQGDATGNNAILVYNLLNREWESVDTYSDPGFLITDLLIGSAGTRNDLYAITRAGGIHVIDSLDGPQDRIASSPSVGSQIFDIDATMTSRGYMCQTMERKRFAEMSVQMKSGSDHSDIGMSFASDDPDSTGAEVAASSTIGGYIEANNAADIRARIGGERGHNGSVTVRRLVGRPYVRGVKVSATVSNRAVISQK